MNKLGIPPWTHDSVADNIRWFTTAPAPEMSRMMQKFPAMQETFDSVDDIISQANRDRNPFHDRSDYIHIPRGGGRKQRKRTYEQSEAEDTDIGDDELEEPVPQAARQSKKQKPSGSTSDPLYHPLPVGIINYVPDSMASKKNIGYANTIKAGFKLQMFRTLNIGLAKKIVHKVKDDFAEGTSALSGFAKYSAESKTWRPVTSSYQIHPTTLANFAFLCSGRFDEIPNQLTAADFMYLCTRASLGVLNELYRVRPEVLVDNTELSAIAGLFNYFIGHLSSVWYREADGMMYLLQETGTDIEVYQEPRLARTTRQTASKTSSTSSGLPKK